MNQILSFERVQLLQAADKLMKYVSCNDLFYSQKTLETLI